MPHLWRGSQAWLRRGSRSRGGRVHRARTRDPGTCRAHLPETRTAVAAAGAAQLRPGIPFPGGAGRGSRESLPSGAGPIPRVPKVPGWRTATAVAAVEPTRRPAPVAWRHASAPLRTHGATAPSKLHRDLTKSSPTRPGWNDAIPKPRAWTRALPVIDQSGSSEAPIGARGVGGAQMAKESALP